MKKNRVIFIVIVSLAVLVAAAMFYQTNHPKDMCTQNDRETSNCVQAGHCSPNPAIDSVIDCDVKDYDHKFNTDL